MKLIFATNNKNKLREIRQILEPAFSILSLADINCPDELPETCDTVEGNASQKAWYIYNKYLVHPPLQWGGSGRDFGCFADDTGLEIESLGGRPGVYSARYAGENCNPEDNIRKVLSELNGIENRRAKFRCVLSLIINNEEKQFEGVMEGTILTEKHGTEGFGYDPIFAPSPPNPLSMWRGGRGQGGVGLSRTEGREGEASEVSFAQMPPEEKNRISHRGLAVKKMTDYLLTLKK